MKAALYFILALVIFVWSAWLGSDLYVYFNTPEQVVVESSSSLPIEGEVLPEDLEHSAAVAIEEEEENPEENSTEDDADESVSAFLEFMERKEEAERMKKLEEIEEQDDQELQEVQEERGLEEVQVVEEEVVDISEASNGSSLVLDFPNTESSEEANEEVIIVEEEALPEAIPEIPSADFSFGDFSGD
jgi:hypothetical protein